VPRRGRLAELPLADACSGPWHLHGTGSAVGAGPELLPAPPVSSPTTDPRPAVSVNSPLDIQMIIRYQMTPMVPDGVAGVESLGSLEQSRLHPPIRRHAASKRHPYRVHERPTSHLRGRTADEAFAIMVRPHIPGLVRLARRVVRTDCLAWDAVQESLLSLWQTEAPPPQPAAWLARTVIHRSLHLRRTSARRRAHEEGAGAEVLRHDCPDGPAHRAEIGELATALRRAISALPADQRVAFLLREVEGESYETIARRLRLPIGTVRSRLHRARHQLQEALSAWRAPRCADRSAAGCHTPDAERMSPVPAGR